MEEEEEEEEKEVKGEGRKERLKRVFLTCPFKWEFLGKHGNSFYSNVAASNNHN